jgi:hypothetical protein
MPEPRARSPGVRQLMVQSDYQLLRRYSEVAYGFEELP